MTIKPAGLLAFGTLLAILTLNAAQSQDAHKSALAPPILPAGPIAKLEDTFQPWPLPTGEDRVYGAIDGKHLHQYVVEQVQISRHYRDTVHPQYWGRITGTSGDKESADWLVAKFKQIGLSDVRVQPVALPPRWSPQPWTVTATGSGQTLQLDKSATPAYGTVGTPPAGIELDAVWAGGGSEADFMGRDVRGKAAFILSTPLPGSMLNSAREEGAVERAAAKGAKAIFLVIALPGNFRNMLYPARVDVPVFALGMEDGYALRDMIGKAPSGAAPKVNIHMEITKDTNATSALIWGTLPGASDEKVYVIAHRDGWFDAAVDNASGVATMLGVAEYFAKMPKASRKRTIIFVGLDGHHNDADVGTQWMVSHKDELFKNTALIINSEHTSTIQTDLFGEQIRKSNTYTAQRWYAGGPSRPKLQEIAFNAFRAFGVTVNTEPEKAILNDLVRFYHFMPAVYVGNFNMLFHSDGETPEMVPWTGLEAVARAYSKIIAEVDKLPLAELVRPPEPDTKPPRG